MHPEGPPSKPPPPPPSGPPAPPAPPSPDAVPRSAEPAAYVPPPPNLREEVIDVLQTCYDPEIPVNIYDLGLVYGVDVSAENVVHIRMTLTSPACPVAESLPVEVEQKVKAVPGVKAVQVELVWDPPWGRHLLSEAARLQLGIDLY